jgi:hypothetical protein
VAEVTVPDRPIVEWVNHASFVLSMGATRLICDPWLHGTAFNDGWRLLSPTVFTPRDFGRITHLWFSHQHPDHFSPRDIRQIAAADRQHITVLYHHTIDKKVVRFCEGLRFHRCVELADRAWIDLAPDVQIMCGAWDDRDSWLAVRTPQATFLNVNDCLIETRSQARSIAEAVGHVDVLFTQFSYANWAGNPGDEEEHRRHAASKRDEIALQAEYFRPSVIIPFASFVWFSHHENFFHTPQMNQVADIARFIESDLGCRAVVMYPGDEWTFGDGHDPERACALYAADFADVLERGPVDNSPSVAPGKIESAMSSFLSRVKKRNPVIRFIPGLRTAAYVTDWQRAFEFTLDGLRELEPGASVDVHVGSDSLHFALKTPWGANALAVNGRYTVPPGGDRDRFFRFFRAADLNDHGHFFDYRWAANQVVKAGVRRVSSLVGAR